MLPRRLLLLPLLVVPSLGQLSEDEKKQLLDMHNDDRRNVANCATGVESCPSAANMKLMVWDNDVAATAQAYADSCPSGHGNREDRNNAGENLAWGWPSRSVESSMTGWVENEVKFYTFSPLNSPGECAAGEQCGHYTQAVWADSYRLGCGKRRCSNVMGRGSGDAYVCHYLPSGNFVGREPYEVGASCSACAAGETCVTGLCDTGTANDLGTVPSGSAGGAGGAAGTPGAHQTVPSGSAGGAGGAAGTPGAHQIAAAVLLPMLLIVLVVTIALMARKSPAFKEMMAKRRRVPVSAVSAVCKPCLGPRVRGWGRHPAWNKVSVGMSWLVLLLILIALAAPWWSSMVDDTAGLWTLGRHTATVGVVQAFMLIAFFAQLFAAVANTFASWRHSSTPRFVNRWTRKLTFPQVFVCTTLSAVCLFLSICLYAAFHNDSNSGDLVFGPSFLLAIVAFLFNAVVLYMVLVACQSGVIDAPRGDAIDVPSSPSSPGSFSGWNPSNNGGAGAGAGGVSKIPIAQPVRAPNLKAPPAKKPPPAAGPKTDLPPGWAAVRDPSSGKEYYYHTKTKETTWTRPVR